MPIIAEEEIKVGQLVEVVRREIKGYEDFIYIRPATHKSTKIIGVVVEDEGELKLMTGYGETVKRITETIIESKIKKGDGEKK